MDICNNPEGVPETELFEALKKKLHPGIAGTFRRGFQMEKARQTEKLTLRKVKVENLNFLKFFPNVKALIIDSDHLSDLSGLRHAPQLTCINLDSRWPDGLDLCPLENCPQLEELSLCLNPPKLPSWKAEIRISGLAVIGTLRHLTWLFLPDLGIKDISWISGLQGLRDLELARNPLEDVSPLGRLTHLPELDLCSCSLRDISALSSMAGLERLYLNGNQIKDFSPLLSCKKLKDLGAEDNGLSEEERDRWRRAFSHVEHHDF